MREATAEADAEEEEAAPPAAAAEEEEEEEASGGEAEEEEEEEPETIPLPLQGPHCTAETLGNPILAALSAAASRLALAAA